MMLTYGGLEYTDEHLTFAQWGEEWKAKMTERAYGSLPVLEVDGKVLSQSQVRSGGMYRGNWSLLRVIMPVL